MINKYLFLFLLVFLVNSCCNLFGPEIDGVQLRVMNNSDMNFDEVFVNGISLGKVEKYDFSDYKQFDELYRYGAITISAKDSTFGFGVIDYAGEVPLDEGYYTYMLSVDYENYQIHLEFCKGNDIPGKSQPNNRNNLIDESIIYITNSGLEDSNGDLFIIAKKNILQTFNPTISNVPNTHVRYLKDAITYNSINTRIVLKTDGLGNEIFRKQIPIEVHNTDNNFKVLKSSYGEFLLAGTAEIFTESGYKVRTAIIKLDQDANYLWTKTFGNGISGANDIIEKSDGTFLVTGRNDYDHTWVLNIDREGNELNNYTFDTPFSGEKIIELKDNFVIAGDRGGASLGEPRSGVIYLDKDINTIWSIDNSDSIYDIIATSDNNLIVVGHRNYQSAIILKFSPNAERLLEIEIADSINFNDIRAYSVQETNTNNLIISCSIGENNAIIKSNDNGQIVWQNIFQNDSQFANIYPNRLLQTNDNNYLIIGTIDNSVFLSKFDSDGNIIFESKFN